MTKRRHPIPHLKYPEKKRSWRRLVKKFEKKERGGPTSPRPLHGSLYASGKKTLGRVLVRRKGGGNPASKRKPSWTKAIKEPLHHNRKVNAWRNPGSKKPPRCRAFQPSQEGLRSGALKKDRLMSTTSREGKTKPNSILVPVENQDFRQTNRVIRAARCRLLRTLSWKKNRNGRTLDQQGNQHQHQ